MIIPHHDYTPRERTVCDLLAPLTNARRLLNIGMRRPQDPRNLWWIKICQANGVEPHVLEVFEPNCAQLRAAGIANVTWGDVRQVARLYAEPFDAILWWHGPEHLSKEEVPAVIEELWRLTEAILVVGCPEGDEPQGICYGNHHERHLSTWQSDELRDLGFQTFVVRDERPYPHITAWRSRREGGERSQEKGERQDDAGERSREAGRRGDARRGDAETGDTLTSKEVVAPQDAPRSGEEDVPTETVGTSDTRGASKAVDDAPRGAIGDQRLMTKDKGPIRPVAIIFDDRTRPETTGIYCRKALKSLVEVEFFHPDDLGRIPRTGFDLYLAIDDGLDYPWRADLRPSAYWAIDTHMDFERCLRRAKQVSFVFAAQKDGAEQLREAGIATARWLPLACDPEIHGAERRQAIGGRREEDAPAVRVVKERDICFVGNLFPGPRTDLLRLLQQYFCNMFVGNAYFEEMARIYSASKIVFNCSIRNDVNMRVFEALASGSLLVTNDLTENGQHELFRDGVHLVTYHSGEELLDKVRYYLRRDELRERIAAAGRAEVLAKHTYAHRMEEVIGHLSLVIRNEGTAARTLASPATTCPVAEFARIQGSPVANTRTLASPATADPYYDHPRPDVATLVPTTAARILEIGCGHGRLGESLKARQACEVIGIELDPTAAAVARQRLDLVLDGDLEQIEISNWDAYFDAIVAADVLEHLADPAKQLARIRSWLKPDGIVVASIPNVRNHSVVRSLLDGNWTYEPAGLLDETHRHFYTRRNIQEQFQQAGFTIASWTGVPGPGYDDWVQQGRQRTIDLGRLELADLPDEEAQEFFVYQWLLVASVIGHSSLVICNKEATGGGGAAEREREDAATGKDERTVAEFARIQAGPPASATRTLASPATSTARTLASPATSATRILASPATGTARTLASPATFVARQPFPLCLLLMVTFNRLDYTKLALESILALDYPDLRIVIWDNASTDGTVPYLEQRLKDESRARLIASPTNRGVVFPMNAVWFSEHGAEMVAKIDNDTWVPPDLLRRLAECHQQSDRFGVLSGFHFRAEGAALADDSRVSEIDGVRVLSQPYVGGCAVMVRKSVLDRLGPIPSQAECQTGGHDGPFMDSGWTVYQQRMTDQGLINGYPWPAIHVDHMEDTRSPRCIRSPELQQYKQALRGMTPEQFTQELCVWRPIWEEDTGERNKEKGERSQEKGESMEAVGFIPKSPPYPPIPSTNDKGPMTNDNRRMRFTQDFRRDFEQFDFFGPPFAFARFADGERAICAGQPIKGVDGWNYAGGSSAFRDALLAALRFNAPDYYVGISDGCCDAPAKEWYLGQIAVPLSQVTFSNIFVNGNYERFRNLDLSDAVTVASEGGDYWVPDDLTTSNFDIDQLVARLLNVNRTILVSAGPASGIIIHRYWQRAAPEKRQVIVDVGSAIDETTKGRKTRQYQTPGTRTAELVCNW